MIRQVGILLYDAFQEDTMRKNLRICLQILGLFHQLSTWKLSKMKFYMPVQIVKAYMCESAAFSLFVLLDILIHFVVCSFSVLGCVFYDILCCINEIMMIFY